MNGAPQTFGGNYHKPPCGSFTGICTALSDDGNDFGVSSVGTNERKNDRDLQSDEDTLDLEMDEMTCKNSDEKLRLRVMKDLLMIC